MKSIENFICLQTVKWHRPWMTRFDGEWTRKFAIYACRVSGDVFDELWNENVTVSSVG